MLGVFFGIIYRRSRYDRRYRLHITYLSLLGKERRYSAMAKFYTLYDEQPPKPYVEITQPSMADQTYADECDIHHIIANFNTTGIVDSVGAHDPATLQYGDTTLLPDYETACNLVANVNAEFANLPSSVRAEFGNDPRQLLDALTSTDEKIVSRLEELGLKQKSTPVESVTSAAVDSNSEQK